MHPIGHFVTTAALAAGIQASTGSLPMTAGAIAGGFFIDLDHYFDYFVFNGQRNPSPRRFLEFYLGNRFRYVVLPLHSYELFALLGAVQLIRPMDFLCGTLFGIALHMGFDLMINGGYFEKVLPVYSFFYRARHGFEKDKLARPLHRSGAAG